MQLERRDISFSLIGKISSVTYPKPDQWLTSGAWEHASPENRRIASSLWALFLRYVPTWEWAWEEVPRKVHKDIEFGTGILIALKAGNGHDREGYSKYILDIGEHRWEGDWAGSHRIHKEGVCVQSRVQECNVIRWRRRGEERWIYRVANCRIRIIGWSWSLDEAIEEGWLSSAPLWPPTTRWAWGYLSKRSRPFSNHYDAI